MLQSTALAAPAPAGFDLPPEQQVASTGFDVSFTPLTKGCGKVKGVRWAKNNFGNKLFEFVHTKSWCWSGTKTVNVTKMTTQGYVYLGFWEYVGVASSSNNFYTWCCSNPKSGHESYRKGHFKACYLGFCQHKYPWVQIFVHGDGTYNVDHGG